MVTSKDFCFCRHESHVRSGEYVLHKQLGSGALVHTKGGGDDGKWNFDGGAIDSQ